jgi:hypothetical protein
MVGNVLLIAIEKFDYGRDDFDFTPWMMLEWRHHTIRKVEAWRRLVKEAAGKETREQLLIFPKHTTSCLDYGGCTFYEPCLMGTQVVDDRLRAGTLSPNTWNPLHKE